MPCSGLQAQARRGWLAPYCGQPVPFSSRVCCLTKLNPPCCHCLAPRPRRSHLPARRRRRSSTACAGTPAARCAPIAWWPGWKSSRRCGYRAGRQAGSWWWVGCQRDGGGVGCPHAPTYTCTCTRRQVYIPNRDQFQLKAIDRALRALHACTQPLDTKQARCPRWPPLLSCTQACRWHAVAQGSVADAASAPSPTRFASTRRTWQPWGSPTSRPRRCGRWCRLGAAGGWTTRGQTPRSRCARAAATGAGSPGRMPAGMDVQGWEGLPGWGLPQ